jgi:hypothetical protein
LPLGVHPIASWEWCQTQNAQVTALSPVSFVSPVSAERPRASDAKGSVVGNRRSRIYHRPACPDYGAVAPQNRVSCGSAAEAERAGY